MNPRTYDVVDVDHPAKLARGDTVIWPADWSATSVLAALEDGEGRVVVLTVAGAAAGRHLVVPAEPRPMDQRLQQVLPRPEGNPTQ
jgi:hypothetical protein